MVFRFQGLGFWVSGLGFRGLGVGYSCSVSNSGIAFWLREEVAGVGEGSLYL